MRVDRDTLVFGAVGDRFFKMIATGLTGEMKETRYLGPDIHIRNIESLTPALWESVKTRSRVAVAGQKSSCVPNHYCLLAFKHEEEYDGSTSIECGWAKATHINYSGNVSILSSGSAAATSDVFIYAGTNGWVISNQILNDLSTDPGPSIVFASGFWNPINATALDYCDGERLVVSGKEDLALPAATTATLRLSPEHSCRSKGTTRSHLESTGAGMMRASTISRIANTNRISRIANTKRLSWAEAQAHCNKLGGNLATIRSDAENKL